MMIRVRRAGLLVRSTRHWRRADQLRCLQQQSTTLSSRLLPTVHAFDTTSQPWCRKTTVAIAHLRLISPRATGSPLSSEHAGEPDAAARAIERPRIIVTPWQPMAPILMHGELPPEYADQMIFLRLACDQRSAWPERGTL